MNVCVYLCAYLPMLLDDVRSLALPGTYHEKITHLGRSLTSFSSLKHLDLSRNALESLEVSVSECVCVSVCVCVCVCVCVHVKCGIRICTHMSELRIKLKLSRHFVEKWQGISDIGQFCQMVQSETTTCACACHMMHLELGEVGGGGGGAS